MALRLRITELIEQKAHAEGRTITQKEVSETTEINESTLSRYAKGFVSSYNGEILEQLADYFQVEIGDLFERDKRTA